MNTRVSKERKLEQDSIRNKARKMLPALLENSDWKCHWCGVVLFLRGRKSAKYYSTPYDRFGNYDRRGSKMVVRDENNEIVRALFATADHIIPVSKGGTSVDGNVVPSCIHCNLARGEQLQDVNYPENAQRYKCGCGNLKSKGKGKCHTCREGFNALGNPKRGWSKRRSDNFLLSYGWERVPDPSELDPHFAKWLCPLKGKQVHGWMAFKDQRWRNKHDPQALENAYLGVKVEY